jgi:hypothetical protein
MSAKTQREAILNHLLKNKDTVKSMSAKLGIQKVSARLSELKAELVAMNGLELKDRWVDVKTRYGNGKTKVKEYWIEPAKGEVSG